MNLLEMLMGPLTEDAAVNSVAKKTGANGDQIKRLIMMAIPILLMYMTRNAKKKEGAESLKGALKDHTDTSSLAKQVEDADEIDGGKIIGHIPGSDRDTVAQDLAQKSGVDAGDVMKVLGILAPAIMSGLSAANGSASKKKAAGIDLSDGIDAGDVIGLLGGVAAAKKGGDAIESLVGGLMGGGQQKSAFDGSDLLGLLGGLM